MSAILTALMALHAVSGPAASGDGAVHAAKRPRARYSVSVAIGRPDPAVPLPRVAGEEGLPLVVIDPGHGGHDPGATAAGAGRAEKVLTLAIARALRDELIASGRVRVAMTRDDDRFLVLEERYGIARRLNADLFLSLHADAAERPDAKGATVYTLSEVASDREAARLAARENRSNRLNGVDLGGRSSAVETILIDLAQRATMQASADFARLLAREAKDEFPWRASPYRLAGLIVLKAPDVPSALIEAGYVSNPADASFLASREGQRRIARGIRAAVTIYFARRRGAR